MLKVTYLRLFEKDVKRAKKRNKDMHKLKNIISLLVQEQHLPTKNHNHKLVGNFKDNWECHIEPDWLLIYQRTATTILLVRTGTHADLFE
jgi:mRNA interferase YafQ